MTQFRLRHGETVAIGIALDTLYSVETGLLAEADGRRVLDCLAGLGFSLHDEAMADTTVLLRGLDEFREHLGGRLTVAMLTGIGAAIDIHEMQPAAVVRSIERLAARHS
jgi:3-dehydroquinate synthase